MYRSTAMRTRPTTSQAGAARRLARNPGWGVAMVKADRGVVGNYMIRLYRPRTKTFAGSWKFPEAQPASQYLLRAMCGRLRVVKGSVTSQCWSEQPCVRPVSAAHRAAGHNALRGSGPGQKLAFNDVLAQVGCPDRRIDRFCITCCLPFQPFHHAIAGAISSVSFRPIEPMRQALQSSRPWPSSPRPCARSC